MVLVVREGGRVVGWRTGGGRVRGLRGRAKGLEGRSQFDPTTRKFHILDL